MDKLPEGNENIPPTPEWLDDPQTISYDDAESVKTEGNRWMVRRSGEAVMWGEGKIRLEFGAMDTHGHNPDHYKLLVGGGCPNFPSVTFAVQTPDGDEVGSVVGTVRHKASAAISPDIRAVKP